jgi:hypothetical protein
MKFELLQVSMSKANAMEADVRRRFPNLPAPQPTRWGYSKTVMQGPKFTNISKGDVEHDLILPYWSLVILAGIPAIFAWQKCRFSLRTLLIATTLVAVGLGAIVLLN